MKNTKYHVFYDKAKADHEALFAEFAKIHAGYMTDPKAWETQFHTEGQKMLDILRDAERRLCSGMMRGGYAAYSQTLSEKYWTLVKKDFPLIDQVGITKTVVRV